MSGSDNEALDRSIREKWSMRRASTPSRFLASPSLDSELKSILARTPSIDGLASSIAAQALLSWSPMPVVSFLSSDQRARSARKNSCSSGSL